MKRIIKKATAMVLTVSMLVTGIFAITASAAEMQDTSGQTPLRQLFEEAGAQVDWTDGRVIVTMPDGRVSVFTPSSAQARVNSMETQLSVPVVITNQRAMISTSDAALVLGMDAENTTDSTPDVTMPAGEFAGTIAMAQATAVQVMEAFDIAAMTIALVDAETGFTWTEGFGLADTNNNRSANADTLFQIGSISKPITAIAVMQLVEQELIDLDEPLVTYIPEFSIRPSSRHAGRSDDITVRMLLNNTSGVPSNWMRGFYTVGNEHYHGSMNNLLDWLATRELSFVPGTEYEYANNNWALLGILVARVMEQSNYFEGFVEYTNENIFNPLGMTRTTYEFTSATTNVAMPHIVADIQQPMHLVSFISAGSVQSSANDMARLMHFILGEESAERILPEETVAYMLRNQTGNIEGATRYGLGFAFSRGADGFETVGHSGGIIHYFSDMIFNLENGLGVFISTNTSTGALAATSVSAAILQTALMEKTGSVPRVPVELPIDLDAVPMELTDEEVAELSRLEGLYSFGFMGMYDLTLVDGQLVWSDSNGIPETPLIPMSDGSFQGDTGRYVFEISGDNVSVLFVMPIGQFVAVRLNVQDNLAPENFSNLLGTYYFVPAIANEVPTVSSIEISMFRGMVLITRLSPSIEMLAEMMGGTLSGTPMTLIDGVWFVDDFTSITFSENAQGAATIDFMGGQFVRR